MEVVKMLIIRVEVGEVNTWDKIWLSATMNETDKHNYINIASFLNSQNHDEL